MDTTSRFIEKTGALIVAILLFALSARLEYEFWLAGSKHTNFLSSEHVAWAIAIASNVAKFLVWGRCVMFKNNKQHTPSRFVVAAIVLVVHSLLCGVFTVAYNFDRGGLKQLQQERIEMANNEYNLMREQQLAVAEMQRKVIVDNHNRARDEVKAEYTTAIAEWTAKVETEKTRFFPGTKEYIGRDFEFAEAKLTALKTEQSTRLQALDKQHKADLLDHNSRFETSMMAFSKELKNQLTASTSEHLLKENSVALTDPLFSPFLNVYRDTASTDMKPAWIILAASVLINIMLELITVIMLYILLYPFKARESDQPIKSDLASQL